MSRRLRIFLLSLALLWVLSSLPCYSEVVLTEEEYQLITNSLTKAMESERISSQALESQAIELKQALSTITLLEKQIDLFALNWSMRLESSVLQKKEQRLNNLKYYGLGTLTGGVIGGVSGFYGGYELGSR